MAGVISGQPDKRAAELTWNPDTDLLMSKLNNVKDEQETENLFDKHLRHLLNLLNLKCCGDGPVEEHTVAQSTAALLPAQKGKIEFVPDPPTTTQASVPATINADDQEELGDDIPTVDLNYPPRTRDDQEMGATLPKIEDIKPPVFSHDQTPYNSPRSSKKKQKDGASSSKSKETTQRKPGILNMNKSSLHQRRKQGNNKEFVIQEEDGVVPDYSDSDSSNEQEIPISLWQLRRYRLHL